MFYWHKQSDPHDGITPFSDRDRLTVYAMDKTIGAIQRKIARHTVVWPDKYHPDEKYVVKKKKGMDFYLHGIYQMVDGKLRRV